MSEHENLWGFDAFQPADETVPKQIMIEQAVLLEKLTKGDLYATVESKKGFHRVEIFDKKISDFFTHNFNIFAPSLDGYSVNIFSVHHGIEMYPCKITSSRQSFEKDCGNEGELKECIRGVLSHADTVKIIRALMAQVKSA